MRSLSCFGGLSYLGKWGGSDMRKGRAKRHTLLSEQLKIAATGRKLVPREQ